MKKLFFILLCLIFPLTAYAKEDKLTIENLKSYIIILPGYYSYEEIVDTHVEYGDKPNTYYYIKKIPVVGSYRYMGASKPISYNINVYGLSVSDHNYDLNTIDKNNTIISVGDAATLLSQDDTIKMNYLTKYTGKDLISGKEYFFDIARSDYDIKKVNFEIILTDAAKKAKMLFSINGKDYYEKLDGLSYKLDNYSGLAGTYTNTLTKGQALSVKFILNSKEKVYVDYRTYIVYASMAIIASFILVALYKLIKHRRK